MNDDKLFVWYETKLVGYLWYNSLNMIGFEYDDDWIANGFAVSQQLPLSTKTYVPEQGNAHKFFANLLPEGNARQHVIRKLKISDSDFELLRAVGGECAGALSILPANLRPVTDFKYKKISEEDFKKIILTKGVILNLKDQDRPRLSLAGVQDKCPIFYDHDDYSFPIDAAPSTHILKFEIQNHRNIPVYEYVMTQLAKAVGLPTIELDLMKYEKHYYLRIKRYDRFFDKNNKVKRLHQEDFCQALGIVHFKKYQDEGGPTFQDCYRLVQDVVINPIKDCENLLRWQIFNLLAGNSDGHAKNLALVYNENNYAQLAPFYDLVCTRAIKELNVDLAFSIGGEYHPNLITKDHWKKFAADCNVRLAYLTKMINELIEQLLKCYAEEKAKFEMNFGDFPALQRVGIIINKQCRRIQKQLNE